MGLIGLLFRDRFVGLIYRTLTATWTLYWRKTGRTEQLYGPASLIRLATLRCNQQDRSVV